MIGGLARTAVSRGWPLTQPAHQPKHQPPSAGAQAGEPEAAEQGEEQRLAPVTLPTGKVFRVEPAARFAISCFALRAVIRAGHAQRPSVKQHLQSLARISEQWTEWNEYFAPDTIVSGLHALAAAGPEHEEIIHRLVGLLTTNQRIDGEWPHADLFQVLDALLAAGTLEAQVTVRRAGTALAARQRADGTFGTTAQQERALIGLRALLWASRSPA